MEDRRRRGIAFENLAKEMLRYPDNSEDVNVGITELQEQLEVPEKSVFLFGKSGKKMSRHETGNTSFE